MSPVSRETQAVAREYGLPEGAAEALARLLEALAAEPDPHTTVSEPARAVDVHVRDSLSALAIPAVRSAESVADIGAGAGFPGLPLAIALPHARVDLIESAGRKCVVIERLAAAAGVSNARAVHARAEEWAAAEGAAAYDVATARAVAPLAVLVEYAAPLLRVGGTFVAWKGAREPHRGGRRRPRPPRARPGTARTRAGRAVFRGAETYTCTSTRRFEKPQRGSRGGPGWPQNVRSVRRTGVPSP